MTERENELKKALGENGTFDAQKAKRLAAEAVAWFQTRLKWIERLTQAYLLACAVVMAFALTRFVHATSTKAIVGFAILLLAALETSILIKLWYWIMNAKIGVLKDVRQLRLENLARPTDSGGAPPAETTVSPQSLSHAVSRWERRAWTVSTVLAAGVMALCTASGSIWFLPPTMTIETRTTVSADGAASEVARFSHPDYFAAPKASFPFCTGDTKAVVRWIDSQGRELPVNASIANGQKCYTVYLTTPLTPGDRIQYTQTMQRPEAATKKGDLWSYRKDSIYGWRTAYAEIVQLPKGAEIVSVDPKPDDQFVWNGLPTVLFRATRAWNERFEYTIAYRLAPSATAEKAAR
jgi:hypothetical protein